VFATVITALTLLPLPVLPLASNGGDKVYHVIAFAGLMLPIASLRPKALIWMIPAALFFGSGIEIVQPFADRSRDLADFWANTAGILTGSAFGLALNRLM
jgi:di/tricarboxylate transporter